MSALAKSYLTFQSARSVISWPTKNFPNNAVMVAAGAISVYVLKNFFSSSNIIFLTGSALIALKLYQMNEELKKSTDQISKISQIEKKISDLQEFDFNNVQLMKEYLKLPKNVVEPMFNPFNVEKYAKITKLAKYFDVDIEKLVTIWNKNPNFNEKSTNERITLFTKHLSADKKTEFEADKTEEK